MRLEILSENILGLLSKNHSAYSNLEDATAIHGAMGVKLDVLSGWEN